MLRLAMEGERDPVRLHDGALEGLVAGDGLARAGGGLRRRVARARELTVRNAKSASRGRRAAAAASVPMRAACTNGIDLRKARRIDCSRLARLLQTIRRKSRFLARNCGNSELRIMSEARDPCGCSGDCGASARRSRLRRGRDLGVRSRQHALPASPQSLAAGRRAHPRLHREFLKRDPRRGVPAAEGLLPALRHDACAG